MRDQNEIENELDTKHKASEDFYNPIVFNAVKFKKYATDTRPARSPDYAIFCELDVDHTSGLGFRYSLLKYVEVDGEFQNHVREFASYQWPKSSDSVREYSPSPSALSLRIGTAKKQELDGEEGVGEARLAHVFIRLCRTVQWRFTEQAAAGKEPFGTLDLFTPHFVSDAIRVASDGTNWDAQSRVGNCTVARFIADSRNIPDGVRIQFNINLDSIDSRGRIIPFIIDPDVGYPGGNGGG